MSVRNRIQHLSPLAIAVICFPFSTFLLFLNHLYIVLTSRGSLRRHLRKTPGFKARTVLISGIDTPQGLRLARAFFDTGHNAIGLDHQAQSSLAPVRFSRAVHRLHVLKSTPATIGASAYSRCLSEIIAREKVDIWINCTSSPDLLVEADVRDTVERTTHCHCFALCLDDASRFTTRESFLAYTQSLGLPVPEVHQVRSRDELHKVLNKSYGHRKYRLHDPLKEAANDTRRRTFLPQRTLSQTYNLVSQIQITQTSPWRLEQDTEGLERYSTAAIIIGGEIKIFAASFSTGPSSFQLLEPTSTLTQAMFRFVLSIVQSQARSLNTHLGIDFCVEERVTPTGVVRTILPIGISAHAHANTLLFSGILGSLQLSAAYLACLNPKTSTEMSSVAKTSQGDLLPNDTQSVPVLATTGVYSFGQLTGHLAASFSRNLLDLNLSPQIYLEHMFTFCDRILHWQDDLYSMQDPLPFWWSYQVYRPLCIAAGTRSRDSTS